MIRPQNHNNGFTVIEVAVVGGLMAFLALLLSSAWTGIGRATVDLTARAQLAQEMDLALMALSGDLARYAVSPQGQLSAPWSIDYTDPSNPALKIQLDNGNTIAYQRDTSDAWKQNNLIRIYNSPGSPGLDCEFTVARNVDAFAQAWTAATI